MNRRRRKGSRQESAQSFLLYLLRKSRLKAKDFLSPSLKNEYLRCELSPGTRVSSNPGVRWASRLSPYSLPCCFTSRSLRAALSLASAGRPRGDVQRNMSETLVAPAYKK